MNDFMSKVDLGQQKLEALSRNNDRIVELTQLYMNQTLSTESSKVTSEVDKIIRTNEDYYNSLNGIIASLKNEIAAEDNELADLPPVEKEALESSPEYRMRRSIYGSFIGRFQEVLKETNSAQADFRTEVRNNIKRQLKVASPSLTEEELEAQVADPEQGQKYLSQQVMGVHENVKAAVRDIEAKYKEILALEKSVEQVHQMFLTLSGLVQEQSEMLNNIERNMVSAKNYVNKGEKIGRAHV